VVFGNITGQWDRPIELLSTLTQDFVVGTESVLLLKGLGAKARPALAALAPLVNDEDPTVALPAVEALVAQIQLESADDFARLTPDDLTHLEKVGQILQGLAAGGQGDPHHYAQVVLKKWQSFGWRPPTAADRDQ
jgi:hypothetical protein